MIDNKLKGIKITGLISQTAQIENVDNFEMISVEKLVPFYEHPFRAYSESEMQAMVESIKNYGVMHPIVIRKKDIDSYEILSGHNRTNAAKLAGLTHIPAKVLNVDDDKAKMIVTETNLNQREEIYPSDKARAYKMQLDILKKQGKRNDLILFLENADSDNNDLWARCPQVKSRDIVAELNKTSPEQISRYIRLNRLTQELLTKVDNKEISFKAGVYLSYLNQEEQVLLNNLLEEHVNLTLSPEIASLIKKSSSEKELTKEDFEIIIGLKKENKDNSKNKMFPFKIAFKDIEKQFKKVEPEILEKLNEDKLKKIIAESIQNYIDELNDVY